MSSPKEILQSYWGFDAFRPLQEEIVNAILNKEDVLAILPTGGGKSICYQVPAVLLDGMCLVISPLVSLMKDQVATLKKLNINAEYIHSGLHYYDVKSILDNALHGGYKLLYVSPERLQTRLFEEYLPNLNVNLIAVDEAHCISQWGHDFRPDYLKIADIKHAFRQTPLLALTASATHEVKQDIVQQLHLKQTTLYQQGIERKNIYYTVQYSEKKDNDLLDTINNAGGSKIVYCRSRKATERLNNLLLQNGISSTVYHAGLDKNSREKAQNDWLSGQTNTIVATTAFGMGIDKPNVRLVVNYDLPEHLEAYYQESGRAGRDQQPATSILLYNQTDINRLEESTAIQYPAVSYLRSVYQSVVEYLQLPIGVEPYKYYDFELADFCKKFQLQALPALYALKLLEREGLWTLSDTAYMPTTIHMLATRAELDNLASNDANLSYVCTGLLRLYGSLFIHPTPVRLGVIAKQLRMRYEEVEQYLQLLHKMEYINYSKPKDKPQLFFHHMRVDSKHLIINTKRIKELKERHLKRTASIIHYITNNDICRTQLLQQYFDEKGTDRCGHCDVCANSKEYIIDKEELLKTIGKHRSISVPSLQKEFPKAISKELTALLRAMVEEQLLTINPDNSISLA
ncbi:MAG: RecQ family ATP-dependent DNA helicase [Flavipsychrobacter sp.]